MTTRLRKRRRRVAEAEAALINHRHALGEQVLALADDARRAATPGRIVLGGVVAGALVGLLASRGRSAPRTRTTPAPGLMHSLTGMIRLASMVMPMLGPLIAMAQGTHASAVPPDGDEPATGAGPPTQDAPRP